MLAIAGGKGGSGKTTTTLGLARAFDEHVVAVDADRDMPNLGSMAGVERRDDGPMDPREHPDDPTVSVLSPPPETDDDAFERWLRAVADDHRQTVVDCPAGAGPDVAVPLRIADAVVVVTQLCAPALRDAAKTAAMARALGTPVVGGVVSRARIAPESVERLVGAPILGAVPDEASPVLAQPTVQAAYSRISNTLGRY